MLPELRRSLAHLPRTKVATTRAVILLQHMACSSSPSNRSGSGFSNSRSTPGVQNCGGTLFSSGCSQQQRGKSTAVDVRTDVEKPSQDYRKYAYTTLPNEMQVMVVSDDQCDRAAAALSVGVGSLKDPKEIQGLAHFCEHMLFLGTEKYPQEDGYNEHLARNGGGSNAYTAETVTNYFFGVKPDALGSSLDRFSQFFISPLFTESATDRELQAVDSEHSKNLQNDAWRQSQLLRSSVNPEHPLNHFMTGNSETLRDQPAREGVDVRAGLLKFHNEYYSANLMKLALVGRESPDELLEMARHFFADVPNRNAPDPNAGLGDGIEAFTPEQRGRVLHIVPVNDIKMASFQFIIPGQKDEWKSKPTNYLGHILGHEGTGSLLAALKKRGLATELSAGTSHDEAGVAIFAVNIMLTEAGVADIDSVGDLVFAQIRQLREAGVDERLWHEMKVLSDMGFKFAALPDSQSTASNIAHGLQEFEPPVVLSAYSKLWEYKPEKIQQLCELLTCDNFRLLLKCKSYADVCDQQERWYGTRFSDKPLDAALRSRWETAGGFDDLSMPTPNPFIPDRLDMKPPEAPTQSPNPEQLSMIASRSPSKAPTTVFFRKDETFGLPKVTCAMQIYAPFCSESTESRMIGELWCMAVQEELNEFSYDSKVAGLNYSISSASMGMLVNFSGYNDKLEVLMQAVADKMVAMSEVSESTFNLVKTIAERNLLNSATRSTPYHQAFAAEQLWLRTPACSFQERLDTVRGITREQLNDANRKMLDKCHVECLLQGNITTQESKALIANFVDHLKVKEPLESIPPAGYLQMPLGWTLLERPGTNAEETNGATIVRLEAGDYSKENKCMVGLASQVLSQKFFDELRTKQQLGYIVSAGHFADPFGFVGLRLLVQSEKSPREVLDSIQNWTTDAWEFIDGLKDEDFEEYRAALVSQLTERPKSLREEFGWNWAEVATRNFEFGNRFVEADYVKTVSLAQFKTYVKENLKTARAAAFLIWPECLSKDDAAANDDYLKKFDRVLSKEDLPAQREAGSWKMRNSEILPDPSSNTPISHL